MSVHRRNLLLNVKCLFIKRCSFGMVSQIRSIQNTIHVRSPTKSNTQYSAVGSIWLLLVTGMRVPQQFHEVIQRPVKISRKDFCFGKAFSIRIDRVNQTRVAVPRGLQVEQALQRRIHQVYCFSRMSLRETNLTQAALTACVQYAAGRLSSTISNQIEHLPRISFRNVFMTIVEFKSPQRPKCTCEFAAQL